jgi:hypothetical protein
MVNDLLQIKPPNVVCEGCMLEKHHQVSFPKEKERKYLKLLELIHSDIYESMTTHSPGRGISTLLSSFMSFIASFG